MMTIQSDVSLKKFNSWRIGGPAKILMQPKSIENWQYGLSQLEQSCDVRILGLGSNVLVRDGGFDGAVVVLQGGLAQIEQPEELIIQAQAGVACGTLARLSAKLGLSGLEFFAGIPGTVGGALRMNAGCWGGETWQHVKDVTMIDRVGNLTTCYPSDFEINYRTVGLAHDKWFVGATFELVRGEPSIIKERIRELVNQRQATQPTAPSCGSVFKNPPEQYAAKLIEQCGLKGFQLGKAQISPKHANFIINTGDATASDIEKLIGHIQKTIYKETGVELQHEVHIIGES